jgi:molecular chaperone Hsp33
MVAAALARSMDSSGDDLVLPFKTVRSGVMGRLVRLGHAVDTIIGRHGYPEPVGRVLGEAVALTALLGSSLKLGDPGAGRLTLQTKTDGPLSFLVVHFDSPGKLRGYASAGKAAPAAGQTAATPASLLGSGHLAMTIDRGGDRERYQGIVPLENGGLVAAAQAYFRQSEQIPTFIRVAVARHFGAIEPGGPRGWHWRAGGLLIQHVPKVEDERRIEPDDADEPGLLGENDDRWQTARILAATVEDHELIDPMLAPDRLLYRLFHEEGVRVHPVLRVAEHCRCSRERVSVLLKTFGADELREMREPDGGVSVTCEFCKTKYRFSEGEFG